MFVIFEEELGVKFEVIDFVLVNRDMICSFVEENYLVLVKYWKRQGFNIVLRNKDMRLKLFIKCLFGKQIVFVEFVSFGDFIGICGNFIMGKCFVFKFKEVVEKVMW